MRRTAIVLLLLAGPPGQAGAEPPGDPLPRGAVARLGDARWRHGDRVEVVAWSPDGKWVASGGRDRTLSLWDARTGAERRRWAGPVNHVAAAAFSPDGRFLAFNLGDEKLRLVEVGTLKEVWSSPVTFVSDLAFSRDGRWLGSAESDQAVHVREVRTGEPVRYFAGGRRFAFAPDGNTIAVFEDDTRPSRCRLYDLARSSFSRGVTPLWGRAVTGMAFTPAGPLAVTTRSPDGPTLMVLDPFAEKAGRTWEASGPVRSVPGGETVAAVADGKLTLWDTAGKGKKSLPVAPEAFAFSPDGGRVAAAVGNRVEIWDVADGKRLNGSEPDEAITGLGFLPGGEKLVTVAPEGVVRLWDVRTGSRLDERRFAEPPAGFALGPDGNAFWTAGAGRDGKVAFWDLGEAARTGRLPDGPRPAPELPFPFARGIATAPGRGALAAVLLPTALIFVRIVPDRDPEVWSLAVPRVEAAALAPDGREMALFVPGRLLFVRVPAPGGGRSGLKEHLVWDRRLPRRSGATAAFAPGGHWLAVAAGNRRVELLEARTGKGWRTLYGPAGAADVRALAFSPDGRLLAAGGTRPGGAVRLWELRSGKEVHAFAGHRGGVERLAFSPDGRLLASAGGEGTVLVWDVWFRPGDGAEPESADLGAAWETLASDDIAAAYRGMGALSAAGERAVAAIREGMKRTAAEQEQARRWVKDLDSPRFAVREAATAALMKYGSRGVPVLREALAAPSSDEALRRIEMILDRFRDKGVPTREGELLGGELRMLRAVQVLERVGGDAAKALLEEIAAGAGEAAEEARAVLRGWGR